MSIAQPKIIKNWLEVHRKRDLIHPLEAKKNKVVFAFFFFYLIRYSLFSVLIPYVSFNNIRSYRYFF